MDGHPVYHADVLSEILSESRGAGEQGFRAVRRSWGDAAPEKLHCGPGL